MASLCCIRKSWLFTCFPGKIPTTVQIFKFCTSRPDVCQCLVVNTPMDNMTENKKNTSMTHVACASKLRSVVMSGTRKLGVKRACGRVFIPGCPHNYLHLFLMISAKMFVSTVQTFNFCNSRPNVRQCLVVKHPWLTCQKAKSHQWPT